MQSLVTEFLFRKLRTFKLQPLALCVLKLLEIPEIASNVKFLFAEVDANRFSAE